MVRHLSDRASVIYLGGVVELSDRRLIYHRPPHPYNQAVFSVIPLPDLVKKVHHQRHILDGELSHPANSPPAWQFLPRCRLATMVCREVEPEYRN